MERVIPGFKVFCVFKEIGVIRSYVTKERCLVFFENENQLHGLFTAVGLYDEMMITYLGNTGETISWLFQILFQRSLGRTKKNHERPPLD
jgi:hypothetical protein